MRSCLLALLVFAVASIAGGPATHASTKVKVGVLKFGTVSWVLETIRANGLDKAEGIELDVTPLASTQATTVGLQGGSVDIIATDWLWVSRERSGGADFTFSPFTTALGSIMVPPNSPIKSVAELTKYLKSRSQNRYGVTNQMAILSTAYYQQVAGFDATLVQYRTAPEALPDVENGTLDFMIMDGTFAMGPVKAGKIRALAVTTAQRIPTLPDVPTMMEAGVPNYEFSPWWGAYLPANTPPAIVAKLGGWLNQISKTDETKAFLERIASVPMQDDSKEADARLKADIEKWGPIVAAAKIEPQ